MQSRLLKPYCKINDQNCEHMVILRREPPAGSGRR